MKNTQIITAAPGTRLVYVCEYEAMLCENVVAFVEYRIRAEDGVIDSFLSFKTVMGDSELGGKPLDEEGNSNIAHGVFFPNGTIDTLSSSYESLAELQAELDKIKAQRQQSVTGPSVREVSTGNSNPAFSLMSSKL
jgi:hypothetical protein